MEKKYSIIDMETGEILETFTKANSDKRITRRVVDKMLENAKSPEELDSEMLYTWCKITNEINDRGQIKLLGAFRDKDTDKKMIEDITITGYTMRIIDKAHPFSGMLKSNHKTFITTWKMLFEEIDCSSRSTQIKLKKFLTENNIVREFKVGGADGKLVNRLILNPFLFRGATHSSQISVMVFQDFIKEGINMSCYPIRWLQSLGYID